MKLGDFARRDVIHVSPTDSFDKAIGLMERHRIHHLPVVRDGKVVGMLSDRDLLVAVGWKLATERVVEGEDDTTAGPAQVGEVMSNPALCLSPDSGAHTAARIMAERKIHAFPLVQDGRMVGIATSIDILKCYCDDERQCARDMLNGKVRECMHEEVLSVGPTDSLYTVSRLLRERNVRHLPVNADGILVGIVSDRDIRRACGEEAIEDEKAQAKGEFFIGSTKVMEVMTKRVETIDENASQLEAIRKIVEFGIGCLPVTREDRLVGILTTTDLLRRVAQLDEHCDAHEVGTMGP